jgi:hypothetical protein
MMSRRLTAALVGVAALAAFSAEAAPKRSGHQPLPPAQQTGPAQSCIRLSEISNSRVRDDWTIDFERGNSRRFYRNVLPHRCSGLNIERAFSYRTSLTELCSTDIIYPLHTAGGISRGPGCGLGQFVPMEAVR